jgi:hypothetical protein
LAPLWDSLVLVSLRVSDVFAHKAMIERTRMVPDQIGRKKIFIITAGCIICGALLSSSAVDSATFGIYSQLILYRFLLVNHWRAFQ